MKLASKDLGQRIFPKPGVVEVRCYLRCCVARVRFKPVHPQDEELNACELDGDSTYLRSLAGRRK